MTHEQNRLVLAIFMVLALLGVILVVSWSTPAIGMNTDCVTQSYGYGY